MKQLMIVQQHQKLFLIDLDNALHTNNKILFYNKDFDEFIYIANQRYIIAVDLDKINLDYDRFSEDDSVAIIQVRLLAWHINFEKREALKKR